MIFLWATKQSSSLLWVKARFLKSIVFPFFLFGCISFPWNPKCSFTKPFPSWRIQIQHLITYYAGVVTFRDLDLQIEAVGPIPQTMCCAIVLLLVIAAVIVLPLLFTGVLTGKKFPWLTLGWPVWANNVWTRGFFLPTYRAVLRGRIFFSLMIAS